MKKILGILYFALIFNLFAEDGSVTVYNQNFAVVKETVNLKLEKGRNHIDYNDVTAHLEPDSVFLRDAKNSNTFRILEQNYRGEPLSEAMMISMYEGKELEFITPDNKIIRAKIIRGMYVPHYNAMNRYGRAYSQRQMAMPLVGRQPIVEVDGSIRFSLPGRPVFPPLKDATFIKPALYWLMESAESGNFTAELSYLTGGMSWKADYNLILPQKGDIMDMAGWVTVDNQSGKTFNNINLKLMAGDVNKIQDTYAKRATFSLAENMADRSSQQMFSNKEFDDYYLYNMNIKTTLADHESKQIEFVRAAGIKSEKIFVYDGAAIDQNRYRNWSAESIRNNREYGVQCNKKIWVMREFKNTRENGLGIPLPKGVLRFYRSDDDASLEFVGENVIDHTPKDETVRVYTGNAFDITGARVRTDYRIDNSKEFLDEAFKISISNHEDKAVDVRIVEHLYRWSNWAITEKSDTYEKTDSRTIEFKVKIPPNSEKTVTYKVHYTW